MFHDCTTSKNTQIVALTGRAFVIFSYTGAKKGSIGKSKEELTLEKRRELERRLQDVSGQLNSVKKPTKPKGGLEHPHSAPHANLIFGC